MLSERFVFVFFGIVPLFSFFLEFLVKGKKESVGKCSYLKGERAQGVREFEEEPTTKAIFPNRLFSFPNPNPICC